MDITIGLDIGQKRDPTAFCVAECRERPVGTERSEVHFLVRHLQRLPLGTPYPKVVERAAEVVSGLKRRSKDRPRLFIDATGVGQPIVDLLEDRGIQGVACYFNHGDRRNEKSGREVVIGKAYLVSRLQALFQSFRLHLPENPETTALKRELDTFEIRVDQNANDRYGAFRVGTHDDLVTALGLAVQVDHPISRGYSLRLR
jgi:hypothetical protein